MRVAALLMLSGVLVAGAAGCGKKRASAPASDGPLVLPRGAPGPCVEYATKLTRCIESPSFPANARAAQSSALRQMADAWEFGHLPGSERAEALSAAEQNCLASIETMKDSGRTSCPGIF